MIESELPEKYKDVIDKSIYLWDEEETPTVLSESMEIPVELPLQIEEIQNVPMESIEIPVKLPLESDETQTVRLESMQIPVKYVTIDKWKVCVGLVSYSNYR